MTDKTPTQKENEGIRCRCRKQAAWRKDALQFVTCLFALLQEFIESSFVNKWLIGRNKNECALRMRAKQLELAQPPLPAILRSKLAWRILVVCDLAMQQRLALRLKHELTNLRGKEPMFQRMHALEDTSATRFHLCLVLYLLLPLLTICRLLWKAAKSAYIKYWVVGEQGVHLRQGTPPLEHHHAVDFCFR